ncbi:S8 family serine peptidase [Actinoplanes sp. NPDC049599]|uniref:S8 family serine peptidase n=1 Tax=Actinoplanes sp. NPDC049599 TaxID=3363903 RepID=UPI0037BC039F
MSWISRMAIRSFLAGVAGTAVLALPAPAQAAGEEYVKYYTVTSAYNGAPENLTEIAGRFLGSGDRSGEIFDRNAGRKQPDGKVLADPGRLRSGWLLVMPWDAVGAGIQYGVLPDRAPAPVTTKAGKPTSGPTTGPTGPAVGGATPATGTRPSPGALPSGVPSASTGCASAAASSTKSDWARLRLAADKAWPQSRGKGQVVAVVDSGVNGAMPQLAGRVIGGADVVQPGRRGDADCLGTGTAMAALVVAQQVNGEGPAGAAPDATVLPVRITVNQPAATPEVQVKAIEAAVTAGATVIALGAYVDASDAKVAQAVATAITKNVVVVLGAPTPAKQPDPQAKIGEGALWVAGVGVDDKWAVDYRKGAVDVSAPGVNVNSLGGTATTGSAVTGSGTHYAVAYTAAEAALVRAAYPELTAEQVTHRIKVTADRMGDGNPPHSQYGWGFLNPGEAVTKVLAEEAGEVRPPAPAASVAASEAAPGDPAGASGDTGGRSTVLIVTALLMIAAALLLGQRIWRLLRRGPADDEDGGNAGEPEIDLYDPRFRTPVPAPVPALVTSSGGPSSAPPPPPPPPPPPGPPPAAGSAFGGQMPVDDGGEDHWSEVGGHWSDRTDAPPSVPGRG